MRPECRILLLEDVDTDAELAERELRKGQLTPSVRRVQTRDEYIRELAVFSPDLVLADNSLPDINGMTALALAKERCPDVPFILVTGTMGDEAAVQAIKNGATDYVLKENLPRLVPAVRRALQEAADHLERRAMEEALRENEERFRALVHNSTDVIAILDAEARPLYANPAGERLFGLCATEGTSRNLINLVHPDDLDLATAALVKTLTTPDICVPSSFRLATVDGRWSSLEATFSNCLDHPAIRGIVVNARCVTERKQAEEALRNVNHVLRTLSACNEILVHVTDEPSLLAKMCEAIVEVGGYRLARVGVVDLTSPTGVRTVAFHGDPEGYLDPALSASSEDAYPPYIETVRIGHLQVTQDIRALSESLPWRQPAVARGCRSVVALPLWVDQQLFGALEIYADRVGAFDDESIRVLEELASDLTFGLGVLRTRAERLGYLEQLEASLAATIRAVVSTTEMRDPYTAGHQRRVADLSVAIATEMGLDPGTVKGVEVAATIHDIGKIAVPAEILSKPSRLTPAEFELVKGHPQAGCDILADVNFPWPIQEMILHHHERLDGSGYPDGLQGDQITLGARILAVADLVEAMASHRPYRPGLGTAAATAQLNLDRGTLFDPDVVDACLTLFREKRFQFAPSS
ncbi:MAG: HD domain-containing phosphohydrolase [Actinomycetota bacterium]